MKLINQIWEKRNLNLNCVELRFSNDDTSLDVLNGISCIEDDVDYVQATIPINNMDLVREIQKQGFSFAETKISLIADLSKASLPPSFQKAYGKITYHLADKTELEQIYSNLRMGIFDTDRFSLDPYIGKMKSGNRYYEWCKSDVEDGISDAYIVYYKERALGFFLLRMIDTKYAYGVMGGLFNRERDLGKGFSVLYPPIELATRENRQYILTGVSSNNISSLRMHQSLGYEIQDLQYIFIKHQKIDL